MQESQCCAIMIQIKSECATQRPYGDWLKNQRIELDDIAAAGEAARPLHRAAVRGLFRALGAPRRGAGVLVRRLKR